MLIQRIFCTVYAFGRKYFSLWVVDCCLLGWLLGSSFGRSAVALLQKPQRPASQLHRALLLGRQKRRRGDNACPLLSTRLGSAESRVVEFVSVDVQTRLLYVFRRARAMPDAPETYDDF